MPKRKVPFLRFLPRFLSARAVASGAITAVFFIWLSDATGLSGQSQPTARSRDGHPDLSGFWQVLNTAAWDLQDHNSAPGVPAGQGVVEGGEIPYRPDALAKKQENYKNRATTDPEVRCTLPGVPRATYLPFPFEIVQTPSQIMIVHEFRHATRRIYMNSAHLAPGLDWWMGDSRGHWEGDVLVVDTTNFNADTWFDASGNFHSADLHVVERFTLKGPYIDYEVTIEDPKVFTRPWKISMPIYRRVEPNLRLLEYECYAFGEGAARNEL